MEGKTTTRKTNDKTNDTPRADIYERVTARIVESLEAGTRPWLKPWSSPTDDRLPALPLRANGTPYRGVNILLLWGAAIDGGYPLECLDDLQAGRGERRARPQG
jgi:antirestriction protein ArdC